MCGWMWPRNEVRQAYHLDWWHLISGKIGAVGGYRPNPERMERPSGKKTAGEPRLSLFQGQSRFGPSAFSATHRSRSPGNKQHTSATSTSRNVRMLSVPAALRGTLAASPPVEGEEQKEAFWHLRVARFGKWCSSCFGGSGCKVVATPPIPGP